MAETERNNLVLTGVVILWNCISMNIVLFLNRDGVQDTFEEDISPGSDVKQLPEIQRIHTKTFVDLLSSFLAEAVVKIHPITTRVGLGINTGGSCTGKVKPALDGERVENRFTNIMHEKQVMGFNRAIGMRMNGSKLKLMDITEAFGYRHEGHPGQYRSPDPNKKTESGPDGKPPAAGLLTLVVYARSS
ncbi:hypothetical protein Vadar_006351 [Vaccinium darrowii]|uniref:Uncharacterized protein n=1 Tax=Vaccinium darrowii TaxID=229202 RepID=A0ACB7YKP6_9ERIC|nr:hypothetical protein Vadar_006351 [Vaccinium darrowii]